jgi:hypothetical protein
LVGHVERAEAADVTRRNGERCVLHAERLEDAVAQEHLERLSRRSRDEDAEYVGTGVVQPPFAGLDHERQGGEAAHPLVRLGRQRRLRRTGAEL